MTDFWLSTERGAFCGENDPILVRKTAKCKQLVTQPISMARKARGDVIRRGGASRPADMRLAYDLCHILRIERGQVLDPPQPQTGRKVEDALLAFMYFVARFEGFSRQDFGR